MLIIIVNNRKSQFIFYTDKFTDDFKRGICVHIQINLVLNLSLCTSSCKINWIATVTDHGALAASWLLILAAQHDNASEWTILGTY